MTRLADALQRANDRQDIAPGVRVPVPVPAPDAARVPAHATAAKSSAPRGHVPEAGLDSRPAAVPARRPEAPASAVAVVGSSLIARPSRDVLSSWRTDVEQIRTSQIRDYYKSHYMPNNATVVVVGDVDRDQVLAMVKRHFGSIPKAADPAPMTTVEPVQMGERRFKIRKPGDTRYFLAAYRNPVLAHPGGAAEKECYADT